MFSDSTIVFTPLPDSDEIEISCQSHHGLLPNNSAPSWCCSLIGQPLQAIWVCENDQGYHDQVILAFRHLHPNLAFIAEGSVLKVFSYKQVHRSSNGVVNAVQAVAASMG